MWGKVLKVPLIDLDCIHVIEMKDFVSRVDTLV